MGRFTVILWCDAALLQAWILALQTTKRILGASVELDRKSSTCVSYLDVLFRSNFANVFQFGTLRYTQLWSCGQSGSIEPWYVCLHSVSSPSHSNKEQLSGLLSVMAPILQRLVTFALRILLSLFFLRTVQGSRNQPSRSRWQIRCKVCLMHESSSEGLDAHGMM